MTVAHRPAMPSVEPNTNPVPASIMTRLALIALSTLIVASCDKHSWESTKSLHEKYNAHGAGQGGAHGGDAHKTEAKTDPHAPKAEPKH